MAKYEEIKSKLDSSLNDNSKPWTKFLQLAEEKTNVPRLYLFGGKFPILDGRQAEYICVYIPRLGREYSVHFSRSTSLIRMHTHKH